MKVSIESAFELLTQEEWNHYLNTGLFDNLIIEPSIFLNCDNAIQLAKIPRLHEMIYAHNNKVGSLKSTYALCRHYYDRGIPDEPWYIAPGKNGESVQYMPNFSEEHWGRQYWFNYFSSSFYLRMSALWDSVMEIINFYYDYGIKSDSSFKYKFKKAIHENNPDLEKVFDDALNKDVYKFADNCRDQAAHGTFIGEIHDTIKVETDVEKDFFVTDENGKLVKESGRPKIKKKTAKLTVSSGIGEYTNSKELMNNMEEYAKLTGEKIQEIVNQMILDFEL